jgi:hypothetical protein
MDARRSTWTALSDRQLLDQCAVDTYRASGPGGQKRNKTSSAVRIRHGPTGLIVIAEESRSQHENRARALRRLRRRLYLKLREPFVPNGETLQAISDHRLKLGSKDERFWPMVGLVLDVLSVHRGRVSEAAAALGVTTGCLVDFLNSEETVWQQANEIRLQFGQKSLKA